MMMIAKIVKHMHIDTCKLFKMPGFIMLFQVILFNFVNYDL